MTVKLKDFLTGPQSATALSYSSVTLTGAQIKAATAITGGNAQTTKSVLAVNLSGSGPATVLDVFLRCDAGSVTPNFSAEGRLTDGTSIGFIGVNCGGDTASVSQRLGHGFVNIPSTAGGDGQFTFTKTGIALRVLSSSGANVSTIPDATSYTIRYKVLVH